MEKKDIDYLKSLDFSNLINKEKNFDENEEYFPTILQGFYPEIEEAEKVIQEIDPDLYIVGDSNGGIEISRRSYWI